MSSYLPEFLAFATVHVLSLISPGPDFLMVLRSSLRDSRKAALFVALGIASGELIHVTYSILGLGVIVQESLWLTNILQYLGGAYLVYIGLQSLRAKKDEQQALNGDSKAIQPDTERSFIRSWRAGFITNVTNIKAVFFTISCFAVFVSPQTPVGVRAVYGAFVVLTTIMWFAIVVFCLTHTHVRHRFIGVKHWIERTAGAVLVVFGVQLAFGNTVSRLMTLD